MSNRPPTYKAGLKLLKCYRLLEKPRSEKELKRRLKISSLTLERYLGVIKKVESYTVEKGYRNVSFYQRYTYESP